MTGAAGIAIAGTLAMNPASDINGAASADADADANRDDDGVPPHWGRRVAIMEEEAESTNFRILASTTQKQVAWIVPAESPLELLFFRQIFTRLRADMKAGANADDEIIPTDAFQRAFGRLFFVLRDPQGFDAKVYDANGNGFVGWGEFCYVWKKRQIKIRNSVMERIFLTFDDPGSSYLAKVISAVILLTIMVSSFTFILGTVEEFQVRPADGSQPYPHPVFDTIEFVCLILFILEYFARVLTCWAVRTEVYDKAQLLELAVGYEPIQLPSQTLRLIKWILAPSNLVDLAAIAPGVVTLLVELFSTPDESQSGGEGGFVVLRLVRLTRIFRVFKLGPFLEPVIVIARTVKQSTKALYVLAFNLALGVVIFGSLIYLVERGDWDPTERVYKRVVGREFNTTSLEWQVVDDMSPFQSIPKSFWWAVVTSTTVGYGDNFPVTTYGYVVAVVCMVWSLVILALPVGVIGGTFTQVWDSFAQEKKVLAQEMRREMRFVTSAIQSIDPAKVSKLMLVEIWNDTSDPQNTCLSTKAGPAEFMGEAKFELELESDRPTTKTEKVALKGNDGQVKRRVTGNLTIKYEWTPKPITDISEEAGLVHIEGILRVTVVAATHLINLDWTRFHGASSPYCRVLCYPVSPAAGQPLRPLAWRSPTAWNSLNPRWNASHDFEFRWLQKVPRPEEDDPDDTANLAVIRNADLKPNVHHRNTFIPDKVHKEDGEDQSDPVEKVESSPSTAPLGDQETLALLRQLAQGLPQMAADLQAVRAEVRELSGRVDQLSAVNATDVRPPSVSSGGAAGSKSASRTEGSAANGKERKKVRLEKCRCPV
eukprot:gnl/TRDRNA2_/TRDRNA2_39549_c0_seq1.p1 gnl/TRDRNA2_/TRDRNA2_39549_c0~~gnl/TRDRNA2_/TRDRNA2_39549_c0_seq1.p1  ORF type:complete len:839 (+),score=127.51 gnl/TRDRNA2_/TRDRNA2_39549_c0_seq1:46-2517(+)